MTFARHFARCIVAATAVAARADGLDDIMKAGVLRVAVPQDFPPFGSVDTEMKSIGLDVEVAALIASKMGVKIELVPVASGNRIAYLQTRKADLVISTLGKSPEREKVIAFTQPYAPYNNSVFGPSTLKLGDAADLKGKVIGVTRGTFEETQVTDTAPSDTDTKRFEDNNATIAAYLSGQVQLVGTGDFVALAIASRNNRVDSGEIRRYRDYDSMPGFAIDQISGSRTPCLRQMRCTAENDTSERTQSNFA